MVLSLWISSGRTMPATISSRTSKLTRISCLPSITRLPFGSTCVTTAARLVSSSSLRSIEPLPSLDPLESAVRMRNGGANAEVELIALEPMKLSTPEFSRFLRLRWVSFSNWARSVILICDGEDVADLIGALVLEEGARAGAPERIGLIDRGLRRRHRHLHRLVARPGRGVLDGFEVRLLADVAQPIERGAVRQQHRERAATKTCRVIVSLFREAGSIVACGR